ncbi:hypothetical protein D082_05500 [Synechocystis sp. PCC 6714]|nr:hypothetical protein D082_05500 [Synechocystis sp. PCC 6714]
MLNRFLFFLDSQYNGGLYSLFFSSFLTTVLSIMIGIASHSAKFKVILILPASSIYQEI